MGAIEEWGTVMRLARTAGALAIEEQRRSGVISDPLDSSILLYTDDPVAAGMLTFNPDLAAIVKTSGIEGVCIANRFPPASHEAPRKDLDLPRIAALYFTAPGEKCPRCRNFRASTVNVLCAKCSDQVQEAACPPFSPTSPRW